MHTNNVGWLVQSIGQQAAIDSDREVSKNYNMEGRNDSISLKVAALFPNQSRGGGFIASNLDVKHKDGRQSVKC